MREYDDLPYIVIERHSAGFAPFLWGALLGAGAALLLAPRSGAQTQEEIREGVRRVRTAAEDRVESARATVERTRDRIEERIGAVREQVDTVRSQFDTRAEQARDAFDAGRRAAHDARQELERRVADVRDSYHAVAEKVGLREETAGSPGGSESGLTDAPGERAEGRSELG
jgi:gas vesicle protein